MNKEYDEDITIVDSIFYQYNQENTTSNNKIINLFNSYDINDKLKDKALEIYKEIYNNEQISHKGGIRRQLIFFCIYYAMYKQKLYTDPYLLARKLNIDCNVIKAINKFSWFVEDAEIIWIYPHELVSDYINHIRETYPEVGRLEFFIKSGLEKMIKEDEDHEGIFHLYDPRITAISYTYLIAQKNGINISLSYLKDKFNINILNIKKLTKLFNHP